MATPHAGRKRPVTPAGRKKPVTPAAARRTALRRLARAERDFYRGMVELRAAVDRALVLHADGKTKAAHRAAKRMLDLEYALLGDCDATADVADAVGLPEGE